MNLDNNNLTESPSNQDVLADISSRVAAKHYNTKNTHTNWDSTVDFNNDDVVDIFDLALCSKKIN